MTAENGATGTEYLMKKSTRQYGFANGKWAAYWWFVGWHAVFSLGFHISVKPLNFEIHLPFGFIRVGQESY